MRNTHIIWNDNDEKKVIITNNNYKTTKTFYDNGNKKSIFTMKNGKISGKALNFYRNGAINEVSFYKNNKFNGCCKQFYDNGSLKVKRYYIYGKKTGYYKEYFPSGQLRVSGRFNRQGQKTGNFTVNRENGNVNFIISYTKNKRDGNYIKYYHNQKIKSRKFYRDGELNGYVFNYDENERPILIGCYNNNMKNGVFQKIYYEDGNVRKEEKFFSNNVPHRLRITYINDIVTSVENKRGNYLHGIQMQNIKGDLSFFKCGSKILEEKKNMNEKDMNEKEEPECCVCYNETYFKTQCNHSVCFDCINGVKNHCPMCRKKLN